MAARSAKLLVPLLVLSGPLAVGCAAPEVRLSPRYGPIELDGDIGVSSFGESVASSTDGLGLDEADWVLQPRADLDVGPLRFSLAGYDASFAGEGEAESELDLGGVVIEEGSSVASRLDVLLLTSAVTWDLVPGDTFDLGLGLGYGLVDYDARIESLSTGEAIRSTETFGVPLLALRARAEVSRVAFDLWVSGLEAKADGDRVGILDLDLAASYRIVRLGVVAGHLVGGYRFTHVEAEYTTMGSDVDADLDLSGPYFGLTLQL